MSDTTIHKCRFSWQPFNDMSQKVAVPSQTLALLQRILRHSKSLYDDPELHKILEQHPQGTYFLGQVRNWIHLSTKT